MLAGELIFYALENNEEVLRIDMETIEIDTYLHSEEFHKIISTMQIVRVISNIYYSNGAPVKTVIYPVI